MNQLTRSSESTKVYIFQLLLLFWVVNCSTGTKKISILFAQVWKWSGWRWQIWRCLYQEKQTIWMQFSHQLKAWVSPEIDLGVFFPFSHKRFSSKIVLLILFVSSINGNQLKCSDQHATHKEQPNVPWIIGSWKSLRDFTVDPVDLSAKWVFLSLISVRFDKDATCSCLPSLWILVLKRRVWLQDLLLCNQTTPSSQKWNISILFWWQTKQLINITISMTTHDLLPSITSWRQNQFLPGKRWHRFIWFLFAREELVTT